MRPFLDAATSALVAQHALITRAQTLAIPDGETCLRRLLRNGVWEAIDTSLYGPTGVAMTWRRQLMAAILLAPPGSLISHRAAATMHVVGGLEEPTPEITVPRHARLRRPWLITHESLDLHLADRVVIDGIPTTGLRRLAMDLGGVVTFPRFKHAIRELRHAHGVTSPELLHCYLRHKRQGRTGGGALRDWLDRYFEVTGTSESGIELVVLDAILDAGLPRPHRQHQVQIDGERYRIDLAYPAERIAIEVDGSQHDEAGTKASDRRRTAHLKRAGWTVIRVRWACVATDLPDALRRVRRLLATTGSCVS